MRFVHPAGHEAAGPQWKHVKNQEMKRRLKCAQSQYLVSITQLWMRRMSMAYAGDFKKGWTMSQDVHITPNR